MSVSAPRKLRVLVVNASEERLATVRSVVASLGHEVVTASTDIDAVSSLTDSVDVDVALVGLSDGAPDALALIDRIVRDASCPVIALLAAQDRSFVNEAAKRGVFAYLVEDGAEELQSALDIVLRRFAEYHDLEGAFARRAVTERAKGILMERHGVDEEQAFERLREHARRRGRRLVDVAQAVCDSHLLLVKPPDSPSD